MVVVMMMMKVLLWDKLGKPWGEHGEEDVRGDGTKPWISIRMCSIFSVHVGSEVLKFWRSFWFHLFQLSHDKAPVPRVS